ncbi:hypothetical protein [Enterovirga rhinocerotis]|uniref:Uncharacterized protein n=1 Tax=Enterovirga rhinocerotis TaxID=1339210 RepID=A0A4V6PZM2_9HYPH|nr:hypothetical protein [Enterovirga rhinocerotis]TDR93059.1 hypothetical protein EV668_0309 [Enterovirga rhinocerotis]
MTALLPSRIAGTFDANFGLSPRERGELHRLGISDAALDTSPPIRAGYVSFQGHDRFELEQHLRLSLSVRTVRAFLILAEDTAGEPEDIVAWLPALGRTATWLGRAWGIGSGGAYHPRLAEHEGLPVWREPIAWLRAERRGVVLLKPRVAAGWLDDAGPLLAEDHEHGRELRAALTRPAPRILVPAEARRAA